MKRKYLIQALIFQIKKKGALKNIFITHNAFGILDINSHINQHTNVEKIKYPTLESAIRNAEKMSKKKGVHFSYYKCAFCDGYHIGRNKENKGNEE